MKGATSKMSVASIRQKHFNPRTHEGCDYLYSKTNVVVIDFNPRTHEGCDVKAEANAAKIASFQSTHP